MWRPSSSYDCPAGRSWCLSRQPRSRTSSSQASRSRVSRPAQAPGVSGGPASQRSQRGRAYPGTGLSSSSSSSRSMRSGPWEDGRHERTLGRSSRSASGSPLSSRISSQAWSRSRARRVPVASACRSRSPGERPRRTSEGAACSSGRTRELPARAQPSVPVVQADRSPVPFRWAHVVVPARQHESIRSPLRSEALRVLQQPWVERFVLRYQPHPASDPAAHLGSVRHPVEEFVGRAPGVPKESLHLGTDSPDVAVIRLRKGVPPPTASSAASMHRGNHAVIRAVCLRRSSGPGPRVEAER